MNGQTGTSKEIVCLAVKRAGDTTVSQGRRADGNE